MAKAPKDMAASVRQRLLNLARQEGRVFDVVLVNYGLERLIYRLSISDHRDHFILKGGMLVTIWTEDENRVTRDADFLGHGDSSEDHMKAVFSDIMSIGADDGLEFDTENLSAFDIREDQEYGGVRLKTSAFLGKTKIPITIDVGFGDAVADPAFTLDYPSLLNMKKANIRAYPPATVVAEKFQAIVDLGIANGRMKDYYDLLSIPTVMDIVPDELDAALRATFERRGTAIPRGIPEGLSAEFIADEAKNTQWNAYAASIDQDQLALGDVVNSIWAYIGPACVRLTESSD
ncbi:nucleotidyl transferase AbiEii/AbiGii toxin family protein [Phaeobacter gallaeciensis]|uniref:nucleotidyl transferase AbiEii/AbiGii toxin family protein n=1 Tax=Phaeobacter gallaeciensis TaxID=60890 RepID=UPI002380050E|nr:nucleotidyl transferase AbiEii/AbiGii toxin family protein [Phaeobacter gallaeciensis]MDE4276665.1 nucleotidyl transferase AbiEii/AbiGii toxin family protein [Phaeobacter gallaeciensis]MDE4301893.1 nucleotidyl transferase AbiEii/AbiGii toxin family protein [Phaeobacter gallaeciensis]MDE5187047.1 nucleotidyl transferase AbiEii/AbiGii toxin family protein [Phaeobacter gallaeciensis]